MIPKRKLTRNDGRRQLAVSLCVNDLSVDESAININAVALLDIQCNTVAEEGLEHRDAMPFGFLLNFSTLEPLMELFRVEHNAQLDYTNDVLAV